MSTTRLSFPCLATVLLVLAMVLCRPAGAETITITGTVVTPDGRPAAGARVFADRTITRTWSQLVTFETTTDDDGGFILQMASAGRIARFGRVGAVKPGFGLSSDVVPPDGSEQLAIRLKKETLAAGTVRNAAGNPVPGATIGLERLRGPGNWLFVHGLIHTTTDAEGRFILRGLPEGKRIALTAGGPGYAQQTLNYELDDRIDDLQIVLSEESVISGLVEREGRPVAGLKVWCHQPRGLFYAETATDEQGRYRLCRLPQGTYNVCLNAPDGWTAAAHELLELAAPQTVENMDFQLVAGGFVTGTLTDAETGQPLAGIRMRAYGPARPLSGDVAQDAQTDDNGRYTFRLPPGQNTVSASGLHERPSPHAPPQSWHAHDVNVNVVAGQTTTGIDFRLWRRRTVPCIALDPAGQPVPDTQVTLLGGYVRGSHLRPKPAAEPGRFEISVGSWDLPATLLLLSRETGLAGRAVLQEFTDEFQVVLEKGAALTGTVESPDGRGLPDVSVSCLHGPPSTTILLASVTDANGRFVITPLPADTQFRLRVTGDAWKYLSRTQWPQSVVLDPGQERDLGAAVVDKAGRSTRGIVMDAERELVPDCTVIELLSGVKAVTDDVGRFELTGIPYRSHTMGPLLPPPPPPPPGPALPPPPGPPGPPLHPDSLPLRTHNITVLAIHPELPLFTAETGIDPDSGFDSHLILEPLGAVQGRVLDAHGKPVAQLRVHLGVPIPLLLVDAREHPELHTRGVRLPDSTTADADGRWSFDALVAGLPYYVQVRPPGARRFIHLRFTPEPGQTIDLGDQKPPHDPPPT